MNATTSRTSPGLAQILVSAVLSLVLGALLCTVYLVLKPVPILMAPPKEKDAPALYYLEGRKGFGGSGWVVKREALLQGRTVNLAEEEANAWIESLYPSTPQRGPEAAEPSMLQVGTPNVRLADNRASLGTILALDLFGWKPKVTVQSRGNFAVRGGVNRFVPDSVYIGSFPAHRLPLVQSLALGQVIGMWKFPEDVEAAWGKLSAVRIEKNQLVLEQPAS